MINQSINPRTIFFFLIIPKVDSVEISERECFTLFTFSDYLSALCACVAFAQHCMALSRYIFPSFRLHALKRFASEKFSSEGKEKQAGMMGRAAALILLSFAFPVERVLIPCLNIWMLEMWHAYA